MLGKIKFLKPFAFLIIPLVFLIIGIFTIPDYGINWDNPYHFNRGQAYLWFFLTGQKDFASLPKFAVSSCNSGDNGLFVNRCDSLPHRSFYQYEPYNFKYWIENDSGHPPLNDILAALTNFIFYQKLGFLSDNASHHLFIILSSFAIVLGVSIFVKSEFGIFPSMVSAIVLSVYPLFFSESHFNIKDPPEAAFFGLTIIFFYLGVVKNNWKFIITSALFAGLALGTKLNIIFVIFIIGPWLIYYFLFQNIKIRKLIKKRGKIIFVALLYLPITFLLVYAFWPYLWQDPARNISNILGYYLQIGSGVPADLSKYIFLKWNFYPIYYILITTQVPILILTLLGLLFFVAAKKFNKFGIYLLTILWFFVPIIRASWPGADIYGGVRQIMEYVPALAVLCGMGAYFIIKMTDKYKNFLVKYIYILIILGLGFSTYEMVRIHPDENVYFNQIVGGLKGAAKLNIPYWGNTYGSVYLEGIKWLNENSEIGSKVALPIGVMSNIPRMMLRSDIDYSKPNWTGPARGGEYGIEMYFEWPAKYWYSFQYYDRYLDPVFVYSVDDVPLLKVWKNDLDHIKEDFKHESLYLPLSTNFQDNQLKIDLGKEIFLTRLEIKHSNLDCQKQIGGYIALSNDNKNWLREPEPITSPQVAPGEDGNIISWSNDNFVYLFAGKRAKYILLDTEIKNSCYLKNAKIIIKGFKKLPD